MKTQFHIKCASVADDGQFVRESLLFAAKKFNLFDNTFESRVPHTLLCFQERVGHGFGLGARVMDNLIIVDFNPGKESSALFNSVEQYIKSELCRHFGERIYFPPLSEYIEAQSTLPISNEAKKSYRRRFGIKSGQ